MRNAIPRQTTEVPSAPTARTSFNQRGERRVVFCTDIGFLSHSKPRTAFNVDYTARCGGNERILNAQACYEQWLAFSAYDARRTLITEALTTGANLADVQD